MKRLVLAIGVGLVVVFAPVLSGAEQTSQQQVPQPGIAGVYECHGTNPDGDSYDGFVDIVSLGDTFRVRWTFEGGSIVGVGVYSGGVFAASYFVGAPAVAVYKVEGDRLVGEWTMGGAEGTMYPEVLTRTTEDKRPPPPPREPPKPEPRQRVVPSPAGIAL